MLKWPVVAEAWLYRDPQEFADSLLARSGRVEHGDGHIVSPWPAPETHAMSYPPGPRDRYYTMARRCHVKQLVRSGR